MSRYSSVRQKRQAGVIPAGFTLIEMLVVLIIASILLLVALPGYQRVILKSARATARTALTGVLARQEQYFINNKHYASDLAALGLPSPYYVDRQAQPVDTGRAVYRIDLVQASGNPVGVSASPVNTQLADSACMAYSISHRGERAVTGTLANSPEECW